MASIMLKEIPREIYNFIVDINADIKKTRQITQYSMESTIYKIIGDSKKCVEEAIQKEKEAGK